MTTKEIEIPQGLLMQLNRLAEHYDLTLEKAIIEFLQEAVDARENEIEEDRNDVF